MDPTFLTSQNPQQVKRNVLAGFTKALLLPVTIVPKTVALSVSAITYGGTMAFNAMTGTYGGTSTPKIGSTPYEKGSSVRQPYGARDSATSLPITPASSTMSSSPRIPYRQTGFQMLISIDTAMQLIQADRDCLKRIQTFSGYSASTLYCSRLEASEGARQLMIRLVDSRHTWSKGQGRHRGGIHHTLQDPLGKPSSACISKVCYSHQHRSISKSALTPLLLN